MTKRQFLLFMFCVIIFLFTDTLAVSQKTTGKDTSQAVKDQLKIVVHKSNWREREDVIMNLRKLRSSRTNIFDTDEDILRLTWDILEEEVAMIKENPGILHQDEYRQYFENLVHLISLNQERLEKYTLHTVLVQLPEWYENTVRVIADEGGEDILPQLIERLHATRSLRSGIMIITYMGIAQGKYSQASINTLKNTYLEFLSTEAFDAADSLVTRSTLRKHAIRGLGVIGDKDSIPNIKPFLSDPYYRKDTFYDPQTGFTKRQQGMRYYPVREEAKRVLEVLERGEKLTLQDILPQED